MELLKLLSTSEIFAQIASFLILLAILRALVWKRLLGLLDARKARVASELSNIEEAKRAIERMKAEYDARLKSIDDSAKARIQEAMVAGEKMIAEMKKTADVEAQKIIDGARAHVKYEVAIVTEQLRDRIVDLVVTAASHLIEERITTEEDKRIVNDFLKNIDKA